MQRHNSVSEWLPGTTDEPSVALSSYVPRLLHQRLLDGPPIDAPEQFTLPAALLLSDIQGFTAMVETFAAGGRAGLEELTWTLNRYFVDLTEEVDRHGGDVLCIAGDAFLCCWRAESEAALGDAALRAVQAGLAVQDRLHGRDAGRGHVFRTRIGIAAGPLQMAYVGGVGGRWELTIAGRALGEAARTEKAAPAGRIVVAGTAWSLIADRCSAQVLPGGAFQVGAVLRPLPPLPLPPRREAPGLDRALRPFVPPAVLDREAAHIEWLAELRHITVLMANLPELDAGGAGLDRLHRGVHAFQQAVERFEGSVRVDVDDKGTVVLAAFGLPPRAHDNDAWRALQAARALGEALAALDLRCGIGIATGLSFCGVFGSERRREYLLRGDVVNLASRLMRASAAQQVCDHETALAVRGSVEFEELPALRVAGRSQPVRTHRPLGDGRPRPVPATAVIGRHAERKALAAHLADLEAGHGGRLTILVGEAGIGKSRLLADLRASGRARGVRVLTAVADVIERSTAYYAWRPVLRALFGIDADPDARLDVAAAAARVRRHLGGLDDRSALEPLAPLLGEVLALPLADSALTAAMSGEVRAVNTRLLLQQLLRHAAAARPTLLLVEDAHWLDSASWALLWQLAEGSPPPSMVVALRPMDAHAPAELAVLARLPQARTLALAGMGDDEIEALMRQRLGVRQLPPALSALVHERAEGHPFYCEELLQTMLESGHVRVADGDCAVGDLGSLDLARSVEGVVLSRLDRLAPGQQLCLKVASVIGRAFRERAVCETHPVEAERPSVPQQLRALSALEITLPKEPPPDPLYQFKHAITREVSYRLMPPMQRQSLHRAAALWLERTHREDLVPHLALLAHHWSQTPERERAVGYLERAGRQALRGGAFAEALSFFGRAIELDRGGGVAADRPRRARWEQGLGTAHYFLGDLVRSRHHLERAVALLDRPVPARPPAVLLGLLGAAATQAWRRLRRPAAAGRDDADADPRSAATDCYRVLSQIYYLDGDPAQRLAYVTVRGVNVGELAGASPALARGLANMGTLCGLLGQPGWAQWYARRAVEIVEREGQASAAAYVWSINSLTEAQRGRWQAARAANAEALRHVQELRDFNLEAEVWIVRATVLLCEGHYAAAPAAWGKARELARRHGNSQVLCWTLLDEVDTLLGRDRTGDAARVLEQALAVPTAAADGGTAIDKLRATAVTRLRQQRLAAAVEAADGVLEMVRRRPPTGYHWADYCASATEVYLAVLAAGGDPDRDRQAGLLKRAETACRVLARLSATFGNVRPRSWLLRGLLQRQLGRQAQALETLTRAHAVAVEMEMPYEQGRALAEIGCLLPEGPRRQSCFEQALALFGPLGADHQAAQVLAARQAGYGAGLYACSSTSNPP